MRSLLIEVQQREGSKTYSIHWGLYLHGLHRPAQAKGHIRAHLTQEWPLRQQEAWEITQAILRETEGWLGFQPTLDEAD